MMNMPMQILCGLCNCSGTSHIHVKGKILMGSHGLPAYAAASPVVGAPSHARS